MRAIRLAAAALLCSTSIASAQVPVPLGPNGGGGGSGSLALNSAVLSAQPANPTGRISTTPLMMGLGVTACRFTPTYSTRVEFEIYGTITNGAAATMTVNIAFGTGAGPANGASATGTTFGSSLAPTISGVSDVRAFKNGGIVTGLTAGTTYWFDLQVASTTNQANILTPTCNAKEVL